MTRPSLPPAGGALQAFAMALITPIYMTAYRIRGWGRLPQRRGATLLINNHQHGLDTTALIMRLAVQGPWTRPIYMAGSRRLFEPGFMEVSSPAIAYLLHFVDWSWMFRMLGVLPIENELRRRSLASFAWTVHGLHGDLPLGAVFEDAALFEHDPADRLSSVMYRQLPEKREYVSLSAVREPYRSEIMTLQRRRTEEDLARIESVLRAGGTLYLTPEGRFSPDGHISRLRGVLDRMLAIPCDIYLLALTYDPFVSRRLSLLYRVVPPARRDDIWSSMAAARPVVTSQLLGAWLRARAYAPFERPEAVSGVKSLLAALPAHAFVDPELASDPAGRVIRALSTMVRLGLLQRTDPEPADAARRATPGETYALGTTRHDKRFPEVADILDHQANFFAETLTGLAALA